jgi:hypothetical protein
MPPQEKRRMSQNEVVVMGELADYPAARCFAGEVRRIHGRYADEVVVHYRLCPFLRDVDAGFGCFCVMLDRQPDLSTALAAVRAAGTSVVHVIFPCIRTSPPKFERFASLLRDELRRTCSPAPVLAAFHPEMAGDETNAHRMVGLLRHAPDPLVQIIPEGLHHGGTVLAGSGVVPAPDPAEDTFARLQQAGFEQLRSKLAEIHADRDACYAAHLDALGLARPHPRFGEG